MNGCMGRGKKTSNGLRKKSSNPISATDKINSTINLFFMIHKHLLYAFTEKLSDL